MSMWILLVLMLLGAGVAIGLMAMRRRRQLQIVQTWCAAQLVEGRRHAEKIAHTAAEQLRRHQSELSAETSEDLQAEQQQLDDWEAELVQREQVLSARDADLVEFEKEVVTREDAVQQMLARTAQSGLERDQVRAQLEKTLEDRGGISSGEAIGLLVNDRVEKAKLQAQIRLRTDEAQWDKEAPIEAERLMSTAVDRYEGGAHLERTQNIIEIPDARTLAALSDPDGLSHQAFCREIGCELLCDVQEKTATVRGDDPLAREVARRVLRQMANRSVHAPDRIRGIVRQVKEEIDREVHNTGRKTIRALGLQRVPPEMMQLLGRLKFRLSYSQNQWRHAVEVAHLAGMLAAELGVDVPAARRAGLLHDIGKAMTHDHEGSHAVVGAEVARRCGESEIVANAIGAHHNEEQPQSPIANLVTAADALSGARPGARRESVTQYITRMEQIQEVAGRSAAVRRVDVMHAGREVRVIVAGEERGAIDEADLTGGVVLRDDELRPLAEEIARNLEKEVTYAGQIRVTVIRESRAVSIAG